MSGPQGEQRLVPRRSDVADPHRFVDCNCDAGQKCPQGKTGNRVRCFIPIDNATIGAATVSVLLQNAEGATALAAAAPTCKGDWLLGTACGKCSRCLEGAKDAIELLRVERAEIAASNTAKEELLTALTGCIPVFSSSPEFKSACIDEQRRLLEAAGGEPR